MQRLLGVSAVVSVWQEVEGPVPVPALVLETCRFDLLHVSVCTILSEERNYRSVVQACVGFSFMFLSFLYICAVGCLVPRARRACHLVTSWMLWDSWSSEAHRSCFACPSPACLLPRKTTGQLPAVALVPCIAATRNLTCLMFKVSWWPKTKPVFSVFWVVYVWCL